MIQFYKLRLFVLSFFVLFDLLFYTFFSILWEAFFKGIVFTGLSFANKSINLLTQSSEC